MRTSQNIQTEQQQKFDYQRKIESNFSQKDIDNLITRKYEEMCQYLNAGGGKQVSQAEIDQIIDLRINERNTYLGIKPGF